ncbi:MAG: glycosyltransferase involved in cell wall biosynthesis [Saprospiraceae bacterium]|jgi:glycosyltransferase involved in cell wall biosynthesis
MHVLLISGGYPTSYNPIKALFHKDQAEAIAKGGNKVGVIAVVPIALREVLSSKKWKFGWEFFKTNKVETSRFQYLSIPKIKTLWVKMPLWQGKKRLINYIKKFGKPDVIHLHSFQAGYLALWAKEEYDIPVVITEHSSRFLERSLSPNEIETAREIFEGCDVRIAVSKIFQKALMDQFQLNFEYVPNCVDVEFFSPSVFENSTLQILHVGNFKPNKNQLSLAKAFLQVFDLKDDVKLIFVGNGPEKENVKNEFAINDRLNQCEFIENPTRKQIRDLYNTVSMYVSSSYKETFGIVLIEAMSMGLPLLATRSGGSESIVNSSKIGMLIDPTVQGISEGLNEMKKNLKDYDVNQIRNCAIENYSQEALLNRLTKIYKAL